MSIQLQAGLDSIKLDLLEHEHSIHGDTLSFQAAVNSRGFSGKTVFWVAEKDLIIFLESVHQFYAEMSGRAELHCGWEKQELFSIVLSCENKQGHVAVTCTLHERNMKQSVEIELSIDFEMVKQFADQIQSAVSAAT